MAIDCESLTKMHVGELSDNKLVASPGQQLSASVAFVASTTYPYSPENTNGFSLLATFTKSFFP